MDIQQGIAQSAAINDLHKHVEDMDDFWETESLMRDMLEGATEEGYMGGKHPPFHHILSLFFIMC